MTWKIGDVKITPVTEIEAGDVFKQVIPDAIPERIISIPWLMPHFADKNGNLKASVQAFVIETEEMRLIVDTCVGNGKQRNDIPEWNNLRTDFINRLKAKGFSPEKIDAVICTHLHFDHVGWNTRLENKKWIPTFPKARYLFARKEYNYWKKSPETELADDRAGFDDSVLPVFGAGLAELVATDHEISDEIQLIPTHGHTPGHVSILIKSREEQAIITGDTIHHPCQISHPEWESFDTDKKQAEATRRRLLKKFADTRTLVIGTHFSAPTAGFLKRDDKSFRLA